MVEIIKLAKTSALLPVAISFVLTSSCAHTPQQREAAFLENGKRYLVQKDYPRAALQFRNAVQAVPHDAEAYYQLGTAELDAGNIVAAVNALRKATQLSPRHTAAQIKLAKLMALSGRQDVAREGEKRMEDVLRVSPTNVDALNVLALNEVELGRSRDAQAHLQLALEKFPKNVASAVALARVDIGRRDLKGAEEVLQKAVQNAPQSPEAATALGEVYALTADWKGAERQFRAALKLNPKFVLSLVGLASAQIHLGRNDEAEATYRAMAALPDKNHKHLYAEYLLSHGKKQSAIREFEKLANQDPSDRGARTRLVAAYLMVNSLPSAEKILTSALTTNAKDVDALLQRSQIFFRSGRPDEAERDLLRVLQYEPDSAPGHYLLAKSYGQRGNALRRRQELSEAVRLDPAFLQARTELADTLIEAGLSKTAIDVLDAAPDQEKRTLGLIVQRNWALLASGDLVRARKSVDRALKVAKLPDLLLQDSVLKLKQRDYAGARIAANEALKQNPEDVRALRVVAVSYLSQRHPDAAAQALWDHAAQHPKSVIVQQFLGQWLFSSGKLEQARAVFNAAKSESPNGTEADMALARLDIAQGKPDDARKLLTGILSLNPRNSDAHLWLGTIDMRAGHYEAAILQFRKVLEVDDRNIMALNNLAYVLADSTNRANEALKLAQLARELAPDNVDVEGTLGLVLYRKGLYEIALKYLHEAVTKDGESSTRNAALRKYHLGETYLKLGDRKSGFEALRGAVKIDPSLPMMGTRN